MRFFKNSRAGLPTSCGSVSYYALGSHGIRDTSHNHRSVAKIRGVITSTAVCKTFFTSFSFEPHNNTARARGRKNTCLKSEFTCWVIYQKCVNCLLCARHCPDFPVASALWLLVKSHDKQAHSYS